MEFIDFEDRFYFWRRWGQDMVNIFKDDRIVFGLVVIIIIVMVGVWF